VPSAKRRSTTAHAHETYSLVNYLAYALYSPLYLAGPIITFNDFMWQVRRYLDLRRDSLSYMFLSASSSNPTCTDGSCAIHLALRYLHDDHGVHLAWNAYGGDQGQEGLGSRWTCRISTYRILEPYHRLAQGAEFIYPHNWHILT
jgi:hypothetical protein